MRISIRQIIIIIIIVICLVSLISYETPNTEFASASVETAKKSLVLYSIFINDNGGGLIEFNGTGYMLNGTDEELREAYFDLAKTYYARAKLPENGTVTFHYSNKTVTVPYSNLTMDMHNDFFEYILQNVDAGRWGVGCWRNYDSIDDHWFGWPCPPRELLPDLPS